MKLIITLLVLYNFKRSTHENEYFVLIKSFLMDIDRIIELLILILQFYFN